MKKSEFKKEIKSETKYIKGWLRDIDRLSKLPDDEFKFKQMNIAVSAIYTGYNTLSTILRNYKP